MTMGAFGPDQGPDQEAEGQGVGASTAVVITPASATVAGDGTQQFTANIAVTWSIATTAGSTIDAQTGLYTAGAAGVNAATDTITATSTADGTQTAVATVTIPALAGGIVLAYIFGNLKAQLQAISGSYVAPTQSVGLYVGNRASLDVQLLDGAMPASLAGFTVTGMVTVNNVATGDPVACQVINDLLGIVRYPIQSADTAESQSGSLTITIDNGVGTNLTFGAIAINVLDK